MAETEEGVEPKKKTHILLEDAGACVVKCLTGVSEVEESIGDVG